MGNEEKYIKDVDRLVPRPDIALEVLQMAHDIQCSIPALAGKIETDPNLTANMLRLANSAYYGHMREIKSVKDIILRLGLETVKIIAITGASAGLLKSPQQAYNLDPGALWHHCHATALLSAIIAKYAKIAEPGSIYTASLLHDVGKVILNRPLQVAISNYRGEKKFNSLIELEQALLDTDHAKVGMTLLQKWGLPDDVTLPVGFHHARSGQESALLNVRIVALSNFLVESIGIRSVLPENFTFNVQEFIDQNQQLPEVPAFQENMERIIEEFFYQFNQAAKL